MLHSMSTYTTTLYTTTAVYVGTCCPWSRTCKYNQCMFRGGLCLAWVSVNSAVVLGCSQLLQQQYTTTRAGSCRRPNIRPGIIRTIVILQASVCIVHCRGGMYLGARVCVHKNCFRHPMLVMAPLSRILHLKIDGLATVSWGRADEGTGQLPEKKESLDTANFSCVQSTARAKTMRRDIVLALGSISKVLSDPVVHR